MPITVGIQGGARLSMQTPLLRTLYRSDCGPFGGRWNYCDLGHFQWQLGPNGRMERSHVPLDWPHGDGSGRSTELYSREWRSGLKGQ